MRLILPNILFFGIIGFTADLFNFAASQAEILKATFQLGATEFQLGLLGAYSNLFYALPTLLTGLLSERTGRRPMILVALLTMGASYWWGGFASSVRELYGVAILRALGTALLWPPVMAWMARAVPAAAFSRFLSTYNVCWATGTFFGFWGAGYLYQVVSPASPFWVCGILAAALLLFALIFKPRGGEGMAPPAKSDTPPSHPEISEKARAWFVRQGLTMAVISTLSGSIALYIFPKVAQGLLSEIEISLLNSVRLVGQMIAFFALGRLTSWHFKKWPVWTLASLLTAGLAVLAIGGHYWQFVCGYLLVGLGFGAGFNLCAYYALSLSRTKGQGSGMMESMIGVGGLAGSLIGGSIGRLTDARYGMASGIVPVLLCAWLSTRKPPARPSDTPTQPA